ncbi:SDR family NAD(P)-dependent oxidoreductase [Arsenicicoccus sp. oral taxon 190]|uniref:SDR family NAD(P)-dependent oxidoreductase n=1 Tax=Arsenicicoccus sp. oral taxon 190 TaxID=1658671 RepID=UPI00067A1368|nr:SDR family NAD(P)-dependent oxidoreductase [Arsenicicoccus sp. oral taxon 190]AKT50965.1 short-chain dehydrogenase [Arsenicicoccus sp. oral taxon 190]
MTHSRTIVITGASDGIGAAAARQLRERGHQVVVVGRSATKTAEVARELGAPHHVADFGDLAQVRALADELLAAYPRIDVLANNAGGVFAQETTADGFDKTLQVNHLAPFLLTHLLMGRLVESGASVVQTSSIAHRMGRLDLDDLDNARSWSPNKAYGDSKLANILFTRELDRRHADQGVRAVCFHPGGIRTNFANDTTSIMRFVYHTPLRRLILEDVDKGGARLTWLADGTAGSTWEPGGYYEKNRLVTKVNPQADDAGLAQALWERSEALLML